MTAGRRDRLPYGGETGRKEVDKPLPVEPIAQLAFHFDQRYCTGCLACQIACKDRHDLPAGVRWRQVEEFVAGEVTQSETGACTPHIRAWWLSNSCSHCRQPACLPVCPTGAIVKRETDGVVLLDRERCIGCRRCIPACPYGAIRFETASRKASKCDFCHEDLDLGQTPACVSACPMRVLDHGFLEGLQNRLGPGDRIEGLPDPSLTQPSLVIKGHRDAIKRLDANTDAGTASDKDVYAAADKGPYAPGANFDAGPGTCP